MCGELQVCGWWLVMSCIRVWNISAVHCGDVDAHPGKIATGLDDRLKYLDTKQVNVSTILTPQYKVVLDTPTPTPSDTSSDAQ